MLTVSYLSFYLSRDSVFVDKALSQHSWPLCPESADCQDDKFSVYALKNISLFLPLANEVWGKVICLQVCVCPQRGVYLPVMDSLPRVLWFTIDKELDSVHYLNNRLGYASSIISDIMDTFLAFILIRTSSNFRENKIQLYYKITSVPHLTAMLKSNISVFYSNIDFDGFQASLKEMAQKKYAEETKDANAALNKLEEQIIDNANDFIDFK